MKKTICMLLLITSLYSKDQKKPKFIGNLDLGSLSTKNKLGKLSSNTKDSIFKLSIGYGQSIYDRIFSSIEGGVAFEGLDDPKYTFQGFNILSYQNVSFTSLYGAGSIGYEVTPKDKIYFKCGFLLFGSKETGPNSPEQLKFERSGLELMPSLGYERDFGKFALRIETGLKKGKLKISDSNNNSFNIDRESTFISIGITNYF
jgi:hypothetical protein